MTKLAQKFIGDMTEQEIIDNISSGLAIRSSEKDEFAEVFTPPDLINELLDVFPASIWKKPNVKWLDPAAGRGFFLALVYVRLMKSLAKRIPNVQERKTHILDNMLFMVELNPANVSYLRKWFGQRANISLADFLEQKDKWTRDLSRQGRDLSRQGKEKGIEKDADHICFDIILGNPPFQSMKTAKYKGSVGNRTLWDKFLKSSLEGNYLCPDGHLAFITPSGWRRPDNPLYDLVTKQNRLLYLHIYGKHAGRSMFGVDTRFDAYVLKHGQGTASDLNKSTIIDEQGKIYANGKIDPRKWPFLPNYKFDEISKILVTKEDMPNHGIPILFSAGDYDARKLSRRHTTKNRYPVVHGITQKGLGIRYAQDRKSNQFGVPKILLNFNERQYPYNDFDGKYGMSQLTFGLPIKTRAEGEAWIRAINSPAFQEIIKATKWSSFQTDYRMFRYFDRNLVKNPKFNGNTKMPLSLNKTRKNRSI